MDLTTICYKFHYIFDKTWILLFCILQSMNNDKNISWHHYLSLCKCTYGNSSKIIFFFGGGGGGREALSNHPCLINNTTQNQMLQNTAINQ